MSDNDASQQQQGDPEQLGDAGKKALVVEREARDAAEKRVAELEAERDALIAERDKAVADAVSAAAEFESKIIGLEKDKSDLEAQKMRLDVGLDAKLPREFIERLRGDDIESLRADAEALKAFVSDDKPSPFPKADPSQGAKGAVPATTADLFAAAVADHI